MKSLINFFWLAIKFIPKLYLRQTRFTYSICRTFTKLRKIIKNFRETGELTFVCKNKLHKGCFAYDAAYVKGATKL